MKTKEYLQMMGLCELAKGCRNRHSDIEVTLAELLGVKDDGGGYYGHVSDAMFEDDPADFIMRRLKLTKPVLTKQKPDEFTPTETKDTQNGYEDTQE